MKALAKDVPFRDLCRASGISRKTGYKWLARFRARGFEGLVDQSTRPRSSPANTSSEMTVEIVRLRQAHPSWGPKKIQKLLEKQLPPDQPLPSQRTISRVLSRAQLLRRRCRRRPMDQGWMLQAAREHVVVEGPNDVWTVDFKGWWKTRDGRRCEPLTVRDACSRYILALRLLPKSDTDGVRAVFEDLFEEYGLPKVIQSDNGAPFAAGKSLAGLTQLSAWWVSLGIDIVRSRPGCPQDNGAHERMHGDMSIDLQMRAAQPLRLQQRACNDWRVEFNHVRPHEALAMRVPADVYRRSERHYWRGMLGLFPDGVEMVQLGGNGKFWLDGRHHVFVSTALPNRHIGLQRIDDELIHIWLHHMLIGHVRSNPVLGRNLTVQPFEDPQKKLLAAKRAERLATAAGADAAGGPEVLPPRASDWNRGDKAKRPRGDTRKRRGDTTAAAPAIEPAPVTLESHNDRVPTACYGAVGPVLVPTETTSTGAQTCLVNKCAEVLPLAT